MHPAAHATANSTAAATSRNGDGDGDRETLSDTNASFGGPPAARLPLLPLLPPELDGDAIRTGRLSPAHGTRAKRQVEHNQPVRESKPGAQPCPLPTAHCYSYLSASIGSSRDAFHA